MDFCSEVKSALTWNAERTFLFIYEINIQMLCLWKILPQNESTVGQRSPAPGSQTGTGPWHNQYRAAQELISYFCFI